MGTFSADVSRLVEQIEQKANMALRKIAIDTTERVRLKSPVDTGQLRASWTSQLGSMPNTFNGNDTANAQFKMGETLYIATDKVYAPMLEYGLYPQPGGSKTTNGFSNQAPQGMVRISIQETIAWLNTVRW
ncbi:HK97 gp10 family phage protein [Ursidibacter arcticus]